MNDHQKNFKRRVTASIIMLTTALVLFGFVTAGKAYAQEQQVQSSKTISPEQAEVSKWGLLAAALAFGLGAVGAGIAIGSVGAAAMGAIAEKPEMASQALIFVALAEGLVVFGFVTALMILGRI
ncbi:MAG TPA: ATP synthase subunit C [Spirochaetia bacterium]|nr:ATP synthase subunit C [Spirochaetia bacterium]